jgi:hypothetical protein
MIPVMMRTSFLFLLLAAGSLSNLIIVDQARGHAFPHPAAIAVLGVGFAQIALCAAWLVYARGNIALQTLLLLAIIFFWVNPIAQATEQAAPYWLNILFTQFAAGTAVAGMIRAVRVWFRPPASNTSEDRLSRAPVTFHFTLADALCCTTALCVVLSVARWGNFPWASSCQVAIFCLILAWSSCVIVSVVRNASAITCIYVTLAVSLAAGALLSVLRLPPQPTWSVITLACLQGLYVACGAVLLRIGEAPRRGSTIVN